MPPSRPMRNDALHEWVDDLIAERPKVDEIWSDLLRRTRVWRLG
jgi:hypothetical protein